MVLLYLLYSQPVGRAGGRFVVQNCKIYLLKSQADVSESECALATLTKIHLPVGYVLKVSK